MKKPAKDYNIIIVDDEPMVTSSLSALLSFEGEYRPLVFNSPVDALEYIKKSDIDLVISDFFMPELNGIDFLTRVKKIHPEASLVLLTGYADKDSAIKAINEIGLYRYLEKPWDNNDLLLCIKNALERSHLIENLEQKILELSQAQKQLHNYNIELENQVQKRTFELEMANAELSAIINNCADEIIILSPDGEMKQANPAFEKICGFNEMQITSKKFSEIFSNAKNEFIIDKLTLNSNVFLRDYKVYNHIKDKIIPVEISFAPVFVNNTETLSFFVGVIRDITIQCEMDRLKEDFIATLTHDPQDSFACSYTNSWVFS